MRDRDLVLCLHAHQPVFDLEPAFEAAWRLHVGPLLDGLGRRPGVRVALHVSGVLLDWLAERQPDALGGLAALARRGQVELLASGHYAPLLAAIPERDRVGQIRRHADTLERLTGRRPSTAWLAFGAWEPHLPRALVEAGMTGVVVPAALLPGVDGGYVVTEDLGAVLAAYPARPWPDTPGPVSDAGGFEALPPPAVRDEEDGPDLGVLTLDVTRLAGEADRFLAAVEAAFGGRLATFAEHRRRARPVGRRYPAPDVTWRDTLARSAVANALHKKMCRVSRKVEAATRAAPDEAAAARDALYRAQGYDAYREREDAPAPAHLRSAAYRSLVAAERAAERILAAHRPGPLRAYPWGGVVRGACTVEIGDLDADGADEIALDAPPAALLVTPADGGGVAELDLRERAFNLLDTGRPAFVDHVLGPEADLAGFARGACREMGRFFRAPYEWTLLEAPPVAEGEIPTEPAPDPPRIRLARRAPVTGNDGVTVPVVVAKTLRYEGDRAALSASYLVQNDGERRLETTFAVEASVNLLAPRAADRYIRVDGEALPPESRHLGAVGASPAVRRVEVVDEYLGLTVGFETDEPGELWRCPIGSPEPGAADYRGTVLLLRWPLALGPGERFRVKLSLSVS